MFISKRFSLVVFLFVAVAFNACTDDNAADPDIPGSDRDKYTGNWLCKETVTGSASNTFTINIQKHGVYDTLYVYNFNNLGASYYAIWLISSNSITIPMQTITQVDLSGTGFYNSGKLNLSYSSDNDQVTALCTQ